MYRATTRGIQITVTPRFLPEQSAPDNGRFVWAYTIEIRNIGGETVQLLSRHWRITDAFGHTEEVRGPGVVGEQPVLEPGARFDERRPAADPVRLHGRDLPDGLPGRGALRGGGAGLLAGQRREAGEVPLSGADGATG